MECGNCYFDISKENKKIIFVVRKLSDITNIIIPFFDKYPVEDIKALNFQYFCRVVLIIKEGRHLTKDGLEEIRKIKNSMNKKKKNGFNPYIKIEINNKKDLLFRKIYNSSSAQYNIKKEKSFKSNFIYMYNRDKTILYYCIINIQEFLDKLNIHFITFNKHFQNSTYYLGKYLFTREYVSESKFKNMSIHELALMLKKDRVKFKRKKD